MTLKFSQTLMVLLICMTFVGQTMASTIMPYNMMGMTGMNAQGQSQTMSMMNVNNHNMDNEIPDAFNNNVSSEEPMEDCCSQSCNCFAGCSSLALFVMSTVNVPLIDLSSKILTAFPLAISQQPKSLYRPPILS